HRSQLFITTTHIGWGRFPSNLYRDLEFADELLALVEPRQDDMLARLPEFVRSTETGLVVGRRRLVERRVIGFLDALGSVFPFPLDPRAVEVLVAAVLHDDLEPHDRGMRSDRDH